MFSMPATFHNFLSENNHIEKIYKSMEKNDYSEVVLTAWDILKETQQVPSLPTVIKMVFASNRFRTEGNVAYKIGDVQTALVSYNKALLFAPKNSKEMALAISNRSMLLQSQTAYIASLADIELCLTMDCKDILKKLTRRKKEVMRLAQSEQIANAGLSLTARYIDTDIQQNSEITCASPQIKGDMSNNPKVVAAALVNPGSVLAKEDAFVSYTVSENSFISCHYCQKISLNLIPCDGCCHVLFCDEQCRQRCMTEYHEYECQIMDIVCAILFGPSPNLMLKAALKIRSMSKSWKKLITDYNKHPMRSGTKDAFDNKSKFSILSVAFEKPFVYGIIYNASFVCAAVIHYLNEMTSFFPKNSDERHQAIQVFSKIMMFLSIHQTPVQIIQPSTVLKHDKTNYFTRPNYGFYSLTGKIKISCSPNVMAVNNNNQLILIALKTINCEEELTISTILVKDTQGDKRHARNFNSYWVSNTICDCDSCDETKDSWCDNYDKLSKEQIRYFSYINFGQLNYHMRSLDTCIVYPVILRALDVLSDVQYSPQYMEIMKFFKACILYFEATKSKNYILSSD